MAIEETKRIAFRVTDEREEFLYEIRLPKQVVTDGMDLFKDGELTYLMDQINESGKVTNRLLALLSLVKKVEDTQ